MLRDILTLSALILAVLLVRAAFKNRVPKRMIYCLWLVVLLKLCLPGTLFSLPVLPAAEGTAPVQTVQTTPVVSTASTIPAPSTTTVQPTAPVQTTTQPETKPETQPMTPAVQETAKPAAKPLTTARILQIVWFSGSALLGLWLFGTWLTFTIRLHKDKKFLGKWGKTYTHTVSIRTNMSADADLFRTQTFFTQIHYSSPSSVSSVSSTTSFSGFCACSSAAMTSSILWDILTPYSMD